jgi:hypothetical protein
MPTYVFEEMEQASASASSRRLAPELLHVLRLPDLDRTETLRLHRRSRIWTVGGGSRTAE